MHGRPRKTFTDKASQEKDAAKAAQLQTLQAQCLKNHQEKIYTEEALQINASLLEVNPEVYTAWNYRKLAIQHFLKESDDSGIQKIVSEELKVVERALKRNPKSYGAWHHRKWVISMGSSSLDTESQLLGLLLKNDSRNFHGWNYRRFVANIKKATNEEELQFTTKKINENFSNYSAWHNRSAILSQLQKRTFGDDAEQKTLDSEYELVRKALYIDSEDQSGWFYHSWLRGQTLAASSPRIEQTWPCNGSVLNLHVQSHSEMYACSFTTPFGTDYFTCSEGIPLILYFSEPIKSVEPYSIEEKISLESQTLYWMPASQGFSKTWTSMLKLSASHLRCIKDTSINVSLADALVITAINGSTFSLPVLLSFTLNMSENATCSMDDNEIIPFSWEDNSFSFTKNINTEIPITLQLENLSIVGDIQNKEKFQWQQETLVREINVCTDLMELEPLCKWPKLTLAKLLMAEELLLSSSNDEGKNRNIDRILELFKDLINIDPSRAEYYKDQHSLVLLDKVTSSNLYLQQYCWKHSKENNMWLRLHDLSLSRISSLGRLLWVQRLDISHNNLRSIEGMEALQLLTFLNLSHNRITKFTALGPIRQLKSLRVLSIAYNQIDENDADTTRYFVPSSLNNLATGLDIEKGGNGSQLSYWIKTIFHGLHLRQLNIAGNPVGDKYNKLLIKILGNLEWLDGISVDSTMRSSGRDQ